MELMQDGLVWIFWAPKGNPKHPSVESVWNFPLVNYIENSKQWLYLYGPTISNAFKWEEPKRACGMAVGLD